MDRFIDSHNHLHGFSFDDWELQGMCGMAGAVLSCGNPHVHREIWRRAPDRKTCAGFGTARSGWPKPPKPNTIFAPCAP